DLGRMHGLIHVLPALGFTFLVGGLSLTGVPPTSGFFSKFFLVQAGIRSGHYIAAATAVGVSLLTLFSMIKIFRLIYWGKPARLDAPVERGYYRKYLLPGLALVTVGLVLGFGAHDLIDMTHAAADSLLHPERYVQAVLGDGAAAEFSRAVRPVGAAEALPSGDVILAADSMGEGADGHGSAAVRP